VKKAVKIVKKQASNKKSEKTLLEEKAGATQEGGVIVVGDLVVSCYGTVHVVV
jgi:hypothetical protein